MKKEVQEVIDALNEELTEIYYADLEYFDGDHEKAMDSANDNAWEILKRMEAFRALSPEDQDIVLDAPITIHQ